MLIKGFIIKLVTLLRIRILIIVVIIIGYSLQRGAVGGGCSAWG